MIKQTHILTYMSYMRLLEYEYVLITYLTNLLMFHLMFLHILAILAMSQNNSDLGIMNDEKDQVESKNTWQGEITFEITADNKEDEQRVHTFNRMETE